MLQTRAMRTVAALLLSMVMSLAGVLVAAGPAHAASSAEKATTKLFVLPGLEADVEITITLRIEVRGGYAFANADVHWDAGWTSGPAGRFHSFILDLRLERYNGTSDVIMDRDACNLTNVLNSMQDGDTYCTGPMKLKSGTGWSADGTVTYDIIDDGDGNKTWQLNGTARL